MPANRGYSAFGDVVQTTADGRPLNELFAELNAAAAIATEQQQKFLDVFTTQTTSGVTSVINRPPGM